MAKADRTAPMVVPVSEQTLGAPAKRRYGRGVGLILGLLLMGLCFVPVPVLYRSSYSFSEDSALREEWAWEWSWQLGGSSRSPGSAFALVTFVFLPAAFGLTALVGGVLRHPRRGVVLLVAGLGLLFVPFVWELLATGRLAVARSTVPVMTAMVGLLWIVLSALVVGGQGALWRGGWVRRRRWAAAGPAALSIVLVAGLSIWFILAAGFLTAWGSFLAALRLPLRSDGTPGAVLALCQGLSLGLVGISLIVALGNLIIRSRKVAGYGYWSGIAGVLVFMCVTVADVPLSNPPDRPLLVGCVDMHIDSLPVFAAIALIITGYGSLWLGDPPRKSDAAAPPLVSPAT